MRTRRGRASQGSQQVPRWSAEEGVREDGADGGEGCKTTTYLSDCNSVCGWVMLASGVPSVGTLRIAQGTSPFCSVSPSLARDPLTLLALFTA